MAPKKKLPSASLGGKSKGQPSALQGPVPPPKLPSKQRIHDAYSTLYTSIKVIGTFDCPVHPERSPCNCAAAKASIPVDVHDFKVLNFFRIWDMAILQNEHTWNYLGDQLTSVRFSKATGKAPEDFVKEFLVDDKPIGTVFGPSAGASAGAIIKAMVHYWAVMSNQWHMKYGTREQAAKQAPIDQYGKDGVQQNIEGVDLMEKKPQEGDLIDTVEVTFGPADHQCTSIILPMGKVQGKFGIQTLSIDRCHEPCTVMTDDRLGEELEHIIAELAKSYGYEPAESSNRLLSMDEARELLGELRIEQLKKTVVGVSGKSSHASSREARESVGQSKEIAGGASGASSGKSSRASSRGKR